MPPPVPLAWRHVVINTRCSWLHGDERGFRNRGHRIHSSGDYRSPPPSDEHEGLRRYHRERSGSPVTLPERVFDTVIYWFVWKLREQGQRAVAVSCSDRHLHALVELPDDLTLVRRIVGKCKQRASHAVRAIVPGSIWSEGGEYRRIKDEQHYRNVFRYIRVRQEPGARIWSIVPEENWIDEAQSGV